jgi:site-specific DNA recombinase
VNGRSSSYEEIAEREGVTKRYVGHLIPLAFLAPEIVQNILVGNHPIDLTAETLTKRTGLPLIWTEQRIALKVE